MVVRLCGPNVKAESGKPKAGSCPAFTPLSAFRSPLLCSRVAGPLCTKTGTCSGTDPNSPIRTVRRCSCIGPAVSSPQCHALTAKRGEHAGRTIANCMVARLSACDHATRRAVSSKTRHRQPQINGATLSLTPRIECHPTRFVTKVVAILKKHTISRTTSFRVVQFAVFSSHLTRTFSAGRAEDYGFRSGRVSGSLI